LIVTIVQLTDAFAGFRVAAVDCTCVAVIAVLGGVCAAQIFVACFGCTEVVIGTVQGREGANLVNAFSNGALVGIIAFTVVVAGARNRAITHFDEQASLFGIA